MNDRAQRFRFELLGSPGTGGRLGRVSTPHGGLPTPAFMPVGTAASVKGVEPTQLAATGSSMLLCNTYHLALRPGERVVAELGGLHGFMRWPGPILTDSGGYQVFSLAELTDVDDAGVTFKNHLDGLPMRLDAERAMEIQLALGADVMMVFDECLPHDASRDAVNGSLQARTLPWAERCLALHPRDGRALFAIGQGGLFAEERRACMQALAAMPFDGFAIGGLSVGETPTQLLAMLRASLEVAPEEKPRYLMGVGSPPEILDSVAAGVDLFDCVLPTRNARNASAMTFRGSLRLKNACFTRDGAELESGCPCATCQGGFSRAYLRHLLMAKEILGATLMSIHNLTFMQRFMARIREAIAADGLDEFSAEFKRAWNCSSPG